MAFKMKGDPMGRNFGIGRTKPGAPNTEDAFSQTQDKSVLTTSETSDNSDKDDSTKTTDDNSAGITKKEKTTENKTTNTDETIDKKEKKESYLEKEGINKDGTKKDTGRRDGLSGGLLDNWIRKNQGKSFRHVIGLSKEQIAKRKAKKQAKVDDAKDAEAKGTETFKQAKLVKRARKKESKTIKREVKRKARDQKKLAKFRKKNPKQDYTGKKAKSKPVEGVKPVKESKPKKANLKKGIVGPTIGGVGQTKFKDLSKTKIG